MLGATMACTFLTLPLPKVLRPQQFLNFTSKCTSLHNGVHFFIALLHRCLRTRRFGMPTLRPSGNIRATQRFGTSLPFRAPCFWFALNQLVCKSLVESACGKLNTTSNIAVLLRILIISSYIPYPNIKINRWKKKLALTAQNTGNRWLWI